MSFDLCVHRYRDNQSAPYDRRIAEAIFDRDALKPSGLEYVEYPDGRGDLYGAGKEKPFDGFALSHFGGRTICERALEIAQATQSLIFWPSMHILFAVTDRSALVHVPDEIKTAEQRIAAVTSVDQLLAAINAEEGSNADITLIWSETEIGHAA